MDLGVAPKSRPARRRLCDDAVSEMVGTVLLVGITVVMVTGLTVLMLGRAGPVDESHGTYSASLRPGTDGLWGTGDELILIDHMGGEALLADATVIRVKVASTELRFEGATLGSAFLPDGYLKPGERWSLTQTVALADVVRIEVVATDNSGSNTAYMSTLTASCAGDISAPRVASRTQNPSDLTTASTGVVTVVFTIDDDCAGVNQAVNPTLYYRLYTGAAPSYTSAGAMTRTANNVWQGTVPDQTWTSQGGKILEYYAAGLADTLGHTRDSPVVSDV
ncbi:MAG TPA: type IV pilin N-terminal domain-containing protein, partial [Candidatus Thermoplasmatota archaeon]|nr:type IV pilin N-terminal domain-containing protein [Candidatus Thermoplasmatota archaeon]